MNICWVIPRNAPPCRRDVQWSDRKELRDGGYAQFRIAVMSGTGRREGSVYVQGWPRDIGVKEWEDAAWALFGAHTEIAGCDRPLDPA